MSVHANKHALPFASEVVFSLPTFCFPSGGYIYMEKQQSQIHNLVLTNIDGNRTYAVCLTYTESYFAYLDQTEDQVLKIKKIYKVCPKEDELHHLVKEVHIPVCICLVSPYPYFNTLKSCLSALLAHLRSFDKDFWRTLFKFACNLTKVPLPPPGPLHIEFELFESVVKVKPPDETGHRVTDVDLHIPLLMFQPNIIIDIITCLLTQQRMVFMCNDFALLTIVIEAIFTYIDPINWRLPYVPVLPNSLSGHIEAPGPFIMGVHSSLKLQVKQVRDIKETPSIVLVDIDKGSIDYDGKSVVPRIPSSVEQSLLVRLKMLNNNYEVKSIGYPFPTTYSEYLSSRNAFYERFNVSIKQAFLDMLVALFGDIFNHIKMSDKEFAKENYIQSKDEEERAFFKEVVSSDAFERFIDERIENPIRRDAFSILGEELSLEKKKSVRSRSSVTSTHTKHSYTNLVQGFRIDYSVYKLPTYSTEYADSDNFYKVCKDRLSNEIDKLDSKLMTLRASYLYLRGVTYMACKNPIEALRDFDALYSANQNLFPMHLVSDIINSLDPGVEELLSQEEFYKRTMRFRILAKKNEESYQRNRSKLPHLPINKSEFQSRAKFSSSPEATDFLFDLLKKDSSDQINVLPDVFAAFQKIYHDIDKYSQHSEVAGVKLDGLDRALVVSSWDTNTSFGMGRLVLTTSSVLFLRDGARNFMFVTRIDDIDNVIKYQHSSVFWSGLPAIKILNKGRFGLQK